MFSASKIYSDETCFRELAQYPAVPKITVDIGKDYDVKSLNVFKDIGDLFLELVTRNSLYGKLPLIVCWRYNSSGVIIKGTKFIIAKYFLLL